MLALLRRILPLFFAAALLPGAARAVDATTVFNEVMYHPVPASESEFIELHNQMAVNMDLSGWRISGGASYVFPEGTTINAGGYLVVGSDPAALQSKAGITGVLGPWSGSLDNDSDSIRLENRIGREMDRFDYDNGEHFPVNADGGGVSLVKRQPGLASEDPDNWTASAQLRGTPGEENFPSGQNLGPPTTISSYSASWNFNQTGASLDGTWAQTVYAPGTGGWESGPGVIAFESDPVALPVGTPLSDPGSSILTHYFQRSFQFSGDPARTVLQLSTLLDDGAVIYLNGFEVGRINLPAGPVTAVTSASLPVDNATVATPITLPTDHLLQGANTLSVELHQFKEVGTGALLLVEQGGTIDPANDVARAPGAVAFAKDVLVGYAAHSIPHLTDGVFGNPNSWIGNSDSSFCGVRFGANPTTVRGIAWGRDNTGTFTDRTLGSYTVQYTTVPNPTAATPAASWVTVGSINYTGPSGSLFSLPSRRHRYEFAPVDATGIRLICPGNGLGSGACIDELEVYSNGYVLGPADVVFGAQLVSREIISNAGTSGVALNEVGGANDSVWRLELRNNSASNVSLGGLVLASSAFPIGYVLPAQTLSPGELLVLDEAQIGFHPPPGDHIFLYNATRTILLDAVVIGTTVRARSGDQFLTPDSASFGAENPFTFETGVVVNEVMYHYLPNSSTATLPVTSNPEEWVELYNRSNAAIDLGGWSLSDAIKFTFPIGTSIPSGGYLVVARDVAQLAAKWPEVSGKLLGNFSGSLPNGGRIILRDARGNPANDLRYKMGGAWPALPDGNGASLELRDPRADNNNGAAWAASDETNDTSWQTVTYRMNSGQTFGQTQWREFRIGMLAAGECLVDDVSVVRDPDGARPQLIQGGDFESLTTKWRLLGNHGASAIEPDPGNANNHVLHVRANGQFSYNHNHIETTFVNNTLLVDGQLYEVSFRARYLSGSNQLNTRGYYSRLARTTELATPARIGTPGAQNSRFTPNIGPTMSGLSHAPVLPAAGESVTIRVRATDPDQVTGATLSYAFNGSASFTSLPMTDQGSGQYSASIPGQNAGTIVQFYVTATDGQGATAHMPAAGPASRALYIVNDGRGSAVSAHELRVIMLPADSSKLLTSLNRMSDDTIPGTAIYRRNEVFYNVGVRLQGTAAGRIRDGEAYVGYDVSFPPDHLFRGSIDNVNIDRSGRAPTVGGQDEIYVKHMFHSAGLPCTYDDLCYFISPTPIHTSTAILQLSGYDSNFVDSQYGGDGTVFNLDGTYEPSTTTDGNPESLKNPVPLANQLQTDFANLGNDKEQYRAPLEPRAGRRADDFRGLIPFCQTMALPTAELSNQIASRMNVDEWTRLAALYSLCGIGDCYMTGGFLHNLRVHVPSNGRNVSALPWDMDFVFFSASNSPPIVVGGNVRKVIELPTFKRLYYSHLYDLVQKTFTSAYMMPWLTHYGTVVGQSMAGQASYIDARRASVLAQMPAQVAFNITTNSGAPFTVNESSVTLAGTGWIDIREFRRGETGAPLAANWPTLTSWQMTVALKFGDNPITIQAYNAQGQVIGTKSITITSTLPAPDPKTFLRITEINYHPAAPMGVELAATSDREDFEFIEVRNIGADALNIGGCAFTKGVIFTFPANTTLAAGESVLIVRNQTAFQARYDTALRIAGAYGPTESLANSGELISLVDPNGAIIQSFTYSDQLPWPANADGGGYSLVAVSPELSLDPSLAASWRSSTSPGGNPGTSDATSFTGTPTADLDGDGLNAWLEYALGTSDLSPASGPGATSVSSDVVGIDFTFTRSLAADDVIYTVETSTDLVTWATAATELLSRTQVGGIITEKHRVRPPPSVLPVYGVRLRAASR